MITGLSACGGARMQRPTALSAEAGSIKTLPAGQSVQSDGDADNPRDPDGNPDVDSTDNDEDTGTPASSRYPDRDDRTVLLYGQRPSADERRVLVQTVRRYYAAGIAGDSTTACSFLMPSIARTVAQTYGGQLGPLYLRGDKTCAAVVASLFSHEHVQVDEPLTVLSVRVKGTQGQVIVGSPTMPASLLGLQRDGGIWQLESLLASRLP